MTQETYARRLGQRLREIRQQQGLSLSQAGTRFVGAVSPAALGCWERGDRGISITRLHQLAGVYRVPVSALLPGSGAPVARTSRLTLDLPALDAAPEDADPIRSWVTRIQWMRGDWNGQVLSVRESDVPTLEILLGVGRAGLMEALARWGAAKDVPAESATTAGGWER